VGAREHKPPYLRTAPFSAHACHAMRNAGSFPMRTYTYRIQGARGLLVKTLFQTGARVSKFVNITVEEPFSLEYNTSNRLARCLKKCGPFTASLLRGILVLAEEGNPMFGKTLTIIFTMIIAVNLSACHTMRGFGQDVQQGGKAIEKSSGEKKKDERSTK
jgi:predicted small secreted protein